MVTSASTGALMMRSASDESIVERTATAADQRKAKTKGHFVRRVTSSFRFRKNRRLTPTAAAAEAEWSEPESVGSKSVPQSPLMERQAYAAANQRAVYVLPPVAPNTFDDCEFCRFPFVWCSFSHSLLFLLLLLCETF